MTGFIVDFLDARGGDRRSVASLAFGSVGEMVVFVVGRIYESNYQRLRI